MVKKRITNINSTLTTPTLQNKFRKLLATNEKVKTKIYDAHATQSNWSGEAKFGNEMQPRKKTVKSLSNNPLHPCKTISIASSKTTFCWPSENHFLTLQWRVIGNYCYGYIWACQVCWKIDCKKKLSFGARQNNAKQNYLKLIK